MSWGGVACYGMGWGRVRWGWVGLEGAGRAVAWCRMAWRASGIEALLLGGWLITYAMYTGARGASSFGPLHLIHSTYVPNLIDTSAYLLALQVTRHECNARSERA